MVYNNNSFREGLDKQRKLSRVFIVAKSRSRSTVHIFTSGMLYGSMRNKEAHCEDKLGSRSNHTQAVIDDYLEFT